MHRRYRHMEGAAGRSKVRPLVRRGTAKLCVSARSFSTATKDRFVFVVFLCWP